MKQTFTVKHLFRKFQFAYHKQTVDSKLIRTSQNCFGRFVFVTTKDSTYIL